MFRTHAKARPFSSELLEDRLMLSTATFEGPSRIADASWSVDSAYVLNDSTAATRIVPTETISINYGTIK